MPLALKEFHPVSHATERQLVRAVREGDDRAFEQLFSRYRRRVTAYVYGLLSDHSRAEDITQEVFISALRRLRQTEGTISFKPWIYEIARNACIDEYRRTSRATTVSLDLDPEPDGPARVQLADFTTPEIRWERKQQIGDLFGAFSSLPDNQHRVLVLRELEGLSYGEIGAQMGMSRPMVESTLFRARRRLTEEYDELASGRRCLDVQGAVDRQDVRGIATLGLRERRRIARHLHHCTDCLRYARLAGVDDSVLTVPGPARRVAALLPFGWLRLAWQRARGHAPGAAHRAGGLTQGTPQAFALGKAAAAAATLVVTGGSAAVFIHTQAAAHSVSAAPAAAVRALPTAGAGGLTGAPMGSAASASAAHQAGHTAAASQSARQSVAALPSGASVRPASGASRAGTPVSTPVASRPSASAARTATHGVASRVTGVLHALPHPISTTLHTVTSKTTGAVGGVVSTVPKTIGGVVNKVSSTVGSVLTTAPSTVGGAVSGAPSVAGGVVNSVPGTVGGVVNKVPGGLSTIGSSAPAPAARQAPSAAPVQAAVPAPAVQAAAAPAPAQRPSAAAVGAQAAGGAGQLHRASRLP